MRVLHAASGHLFGGVERMLAEIAHASSVSGAMEPEFALLVDARLATELRGAAVPVHILGRGGDVELEKTTEVKGAFEDVVGSGQYDAVICHMFMLQAVLGDVPRRQGVRGLAWGHGASLPIWDWWAARVPPDHVIYNSEHTRRTAGHPYPTVPSTVIHPPLSAPDVLAVGQRHAIRASLATPQEAPVILHASRLEPMKGQEALLRALALIDGRDDWICWMAGGPQLPQEAVFLDELKRLAGQLGIGDRVRFLGERNDVPALMQSADVFCQPNRTPEGFGMTFVEALYAGIPVVTMDFGGAREVVTSDVGVLLDAAADPIGIAAAIKMWLADEEGRRRVRRRGPRRAHGLCDPAERLKTLACVIAGIKEPGHRPVTRHPRDTPESSQ